MGVTRQLEDCRRLAERKGWLIAAEFVDDDVSAWSGKHRPEYQRCMAMLEAGQLDGLIVYDLDRLHRQPRELEDFIVVCERLRLVNVASVSGDIDLTHADGQFQARILAAVAKKESDDKSRRIRRKHEELAVAGKPSGGGSRPYGYEEDKETIRASEAGIVREVARRFLAGESIKSISADLTERGITGASGGRWEPNSVRRLLNSARIGGMREHNGEIVAEATWPGIISKTDSARIRAILADPERNTHRSGRSYLLRRLLRCSLCGHYLHSRPREEKRRYVCAKNLGGCGHMYVNADDVEVFTLEACFQRLDTPELAANLAGANAEDPEAERWQQEADDAQAQLEELAAAYGKREISMGELRVARKLIEERRDAARRQLAKATRVTVLDGYVGNAAALRRDWATTDLNRQHAIISAVLDHVEVRPARQGYNRFDESRLTPVWRL